MIFQFQELNMCPCEHHNLCSSSDRPSFEEKFGINKQLASKICELAFKNDIAKLTLEIAEPKVLEIVKDIKVTFPDILGTIGEKMNLQFCHEQILYQTLELFRGNNRFIHRAEPHKRH